MTHTNYNSTLPVEVVYLRELKLNVHFERKYRQIMMKYDPFKKKHKELYRVL